VDFTLPDNSCLVDYSLIPVLESQYPFSNRQVWADPDIEQAVWYMRKLVSEPTFGNSIGQKASVYIKDNFNPKRIGRLYEERLSNLDFF
jgi:hypothetical protein